MDFPDIGSHCMHQSCNRLDFLPFVCKWCELSFCAEHGPIANHHCPKSDQPLQVSDAVADDMPRGYPCSLEFCKKRELASIYCPKCMRQLCLSHRLPLDHACTAMASAPIPDARSGREKVEAIIGKPLVGVDVKEGKDVEMSRKIMDIKARMNAGGCVDPLTVHLCACDGCRLSGTEFQTCCECSKHLCTEHLPLANHACRTSEDSNSTDASAAKPKQPTKVISKTARKVLEMKMKMKALGDDEKVSLCDRVFLNVICDDRPPEPMFFHCDWSVGKVIDMIAEARKLSNTNHVATAKRKLRLFQEDDVQLPTDKRLVEVFSGDSFSLQNYGTVMVKYVDA